MSEDQSKIQNTLSERESTWKVIKGEMLAGAGMSSVLIFANILLRAFLSSRKK